MSMGSGRGRVLVVDDDPSVLTYLARVLERAGFEVTRAPDAAAALVVAKSTVFDAVLTDIWLPGTDGLALLRALRQHDHELPVLLITGAPTVASAARAVEEGALRYLSKPLDPEELVRATEEAVRLGRLARVKGEILSLLGSERERTPDRAAQEANFRSAIAGLWMAAQPIVRCSTGTLYGWEVLARSDEPTLPNAPALLECAESLGELHTFGRAVRSLSAALAEQLPAGTRLFVNLHPTELNDQNLYDLDAPLSAVAGRVVLEITERERVPAGAELPRRLGSLRTAGYRVALDDMGAGYAGLTSLVQLKPEVVKVDMSLVRGVDQDPVRGRLIGVLARLCSDMGVDVIAEGIETEGERDALRALGCDIQQGYFFGRPTRPIDGLPVPRNFVRP